jgi:tetratricopeptide (TPR) repeat protein
MNMQNAKQAWILLFFLMLIACATIGRKEASDHADVKGPHPANRELAEATRNVGEAYLADGNLISALRELKKSEALNPDDHITQYDLGLLYYYRERYDQAIEHFEKAIRLKNDYAPAINSLGNVYSAKGDWDKAIEIYKSIAEDAFYGTPHFTLSNMAIAYYHKKEYGPAEKYFNEALALKKDFVNALWGLAKTYNATGRYSEAIGKLEAALKKDPKSAVVHYELGKSYQGLGERTKAQNEFAQVVQLAPDSPLAADAQKAIFDLQP